MFLTFLTVPTGPHLPLPSKANSEPLPPRERRREKRGNARLVLSALPGKRAYATSLISVEPQFFFTDSMPFLAAASEEYISLFPMTC